MFPCDAMLARCISLILLYPNWSSFFNFCLAVNYVAISEALGVAPSVLAAGLAADNVICAVYFSTLFALASKIPAEASTASTSSV